MNTGLRRISMIDLLFRITLSNAGISLALAIVAVVVGKTLKRPALTHLLWLEPHRDFSPGCRAQ